MKKKKLVAWLLLLCWLFGSALSAYAQSTDNTDQPIGIFLPLITSSNDDPAFADEAFVEPEFSSDNTVISAATAHIIRPSGYTTVNGLAGGQPVGNLHNQDQSGTQNDWNRYVEFLTPGSSKYIGYRSYKLPVSIDPESIIVVQINANYLGPEKSFQTWTWTIYNWSTKQWISVGNNTGAPPWRWHFFQFKVGGTLRNYINNNTREIRIRLQSNNTQDDMDLDYEAILLTASGSVATPTPTRTPTRTPLPTTPTPTKTPTPVRPTPTPTIPVQPNQPLHILIPLYNYPTWWNANSYVWDDVAAANRIAPITAIINPNNGPDGGPPNSDYQKGLSDLRAANVTLIGYVSTDYGNRNIDQVKADIDLYAVYYNINGIFLDETASGTDELIYYTQLYNHIKSKPGLSQVVLNPGTQIAKEYVSQPAGDTAVVFENGSGWPSYVPNSYVGAYPAARFAMLAYDVTNLTIMQSYVDLARQRNIGYVYVTDDGGANPWDTLPSYWSTFVNYVALH